MIFFVTKQLQNKKFFTLKNLFKNSIKRAQEIHNIMLYKLDIDIISHLK